MQSRDDARLTGSQVQAACVLEERVASDQNCDARAAAGLEAAARAAASVVNPGP